MRLFFRSYRVPLSVPYWKGATYRGILRAFFSGRVIEGPDLGKLRTAVIERLGVEEAILCGSGSLALEFALRECGVREGDEVVIPTFCCTSVVPPIVVVGARPVLADIGEELNITAETVEAALTNKTKAIVVPHLFGNPAGIHAIIDLARSKNIRVIDDAAQALGATIDGRPVGAFGDLGILSFGSEKVCFGLGGGVVVYREKENLQSSLNISLSPAQLSPTLRNFLSTLFWRRWRRWTLPVQTWLSHPTRSDPDSPPSPYRKENLSNLNAVVASSLLQTLDENLAARRARVRAYQDLLGSDERLRLVTHQPGSACLSQVVRVLPGRRGNDLSAHLVEVLHNAGYEVQGSYVPIHLVACHQTLARQRLPYAERVWSDLIELPCEPEVSFAHVERIARITRQVLGNCANSTVKGCRRLNAAVAKAGQKQVTGRAFMNHRILTIAAALLCASFMDGAYAAELITLRYGQNASSAGSLSSLPLAVAERKGFFIREGLKLDVVPIPGGTDRIVAALDKGEIDAGKNATPYLIQAVLKGSDAVAIIAQTTNPVYSLIVRPEIKSFADLKGKVIGLSTPGDTITLSTVRLLAHKGIKSSDFPAKAVVGTSARFDCLKAGECAAVPMGQPEDLGAIKQSYPRLGFTYESGADLIFNVDMARRAWGEKNQATLVRLVRGFAASYEFINDPKNHVEVTNIVMESLKVSEETARQIFAPYTQPDKNVLPKKGELSLSAFNRVLALMGEAGVIPTPAPAAERFIDLRYLQAAGIQ